MIDDTDLQGRGDRPAGSLITADKVKGTEVYDAAGEKLGSIDSIMIDKQSGEVAYVVMSFGGFLGIGEKFHPLPWDVLDYDPSISGYRVDLDRQMLEGAPAYGREDVDSFDYDRDGAEIDSYYAPETSMIDGAPDYPGGSRAGVARSVAPSGSRADDGIVHGTGSDANDGKGDRPLGYFSSAAQAQRGNDVGAVVPGVTPDPTLPIVGQDGETPKSGFYSPEQQAARNPIDVDNLRTDNGGPTSAPANVDGSPRR